MQSAFGNQAILRMRVSQPGDALEREADQAAERVMQKADAGVLSRKCEACEEEEVNRQEDEPERAGPSEGAGPEAEAEEDDEEDDESGMPKVETSGAAPPHTVSRDVVPSGGGRPLDAPVQRFMGERFGRDFSGVQIHTDSDAARSARELNAQAYTVGSHIYFSQGRYAPQGDPGRRLLAHELAHVVQTGGAPQLVQRQDDGGEGAGPAAPSFDRDPACESKPCPQKKQKKVVHGDCGDSDPVDPKLFITNLDVSLGAYTVDVTWSDGKTFTWPTTPNKKKTPKGPDVVGVKCTINHTNRKKDGMAWFTGFKKQGKRIGFHDSQDMGKAFKSHGCVRVCCNHAEIINKHSKSNSTKISVS